MSLRLFTAILPPETVRRELAELEEPLDAVRWIPAENVHLTLRFIGEVGEERLERYESALGRVRVEPFILPVGGVGLFPTRGPARVLWAGTANAHTRLFQLRKQVDDALLSVDVSLDVRSFHPHFTIARIGEGHDTKQLAAFVHRHAKLEAPPFRVDEFHLMASELQPTGAPRYRSVRAFALS